ncbi:hypothetical protein IFM89_002614 [Coptis chinensis]|uniref:Uncharacterized protein n=1 Tax=Coptis chinensis TaxID=261450 RepID=A0A835GWV2_9MAGN|nr:hypothetical protein IFM89_002614 [Coptis chinensis]
MGRQRAPCCDKTGLRKGPWSPAEDQKLSSYIRAEGHGNWRALPSKAGLLRCGKSCRLRWINYLRPDIKRGNFSRSEEETIIKLHESIGNKWSKIASQLPGRTDNEIKNVWNTHLKKRLALRGSNACGDEAKESSSSSSSFSSSSCSSSANSSISYSNPNIAEMEPFKGTSEIPYEQKTEDEFCFSLPSVFSFSENEVHLHPTVLEKISKIKDDRSWMAYLENELGLDDNQESVARDEVHQLGTSSSNNEILLEANIDPVSMYFQTWPSSPPTF